MAGLLALVLGAREMWTQGRLRRKGLRVRGRVVGSHQNLASKGRDVSEVIEFHDAQGGRHMFVSRTAGGREFPVGAEVPVRYLPADPEVARMDRFYRKFFGVHVGDGLGAPH
ncbi:DUF3592 domain-containing protein [Streptomyces sp. NPDC058382]|uniref:DUF3592 domain-containing protein n=1 Tax=unclassified Streptomyces TaxID=2593676 RepID=UPI00363E0D20